MEECWNSLAFVLAHSLAPNSKTCPCAKVKIVHVELECGRKTILKSSSPGSPQFFSFQLPQLKYHLPNIGTQYSCLNYQLLYITDLLGTCTVYYQLHKFTPLVSLQYYTYTCPYSTSPVATWTLQVLVDLRHLRFFNLSSFVWLKPNSFQAYMLVSSSLHVDFEQKIENFRLRVEQSGEGGTWGKTVAKWRSGENDSLPYVLGCFWRTLWTSSL